MPQNNGLTIKQGGTTVAGVQVIEVTGATVSGRSPVAVLEIDGGGSAAGPLGTVQMSDGAGGFVVSDFVDNLTVPGSATAELVDGAGILGTLLSFPGLLVSPGALAIGPTGTVASSGFLELDAIATTGPATFGFFSANGTPNALTKTLANDVMFFLRGAGYTGASPALAMTLKVTAASDFDGTPTTTIDLANASNLGLHVGADGTFSVDNGIAVGVDAQTAVAGAATTTTPNVIVTSEALTGATSYALTLTSPFITTTSVIQVTAMNSDGLVTWPASIVCSSGSAVITVGMAALTGTVVMNIGVNN